MKNSKVLNMTKGLPKFSDLPRNEQIDYFISRVSGHEKEVEIFNILSIFTAYNLPQDTYLKHFDTLSVDEIEDTLFKYLNGPCDVEEIAWNTIIDTLGTDKVFDIIDNIDYYMKDYIAITIPLKEVRRQAMKLFAKLT